MLNLDQVLYLQIMKKTINGIVNMVLLKTWIKLNKNLQINEI